METGEILNASCSEISPVVLSLTHNGWLGSTCTKDMLPHHPHPQEDAIVILRRSWGGLVWLAMVRKDRRMSTIAIYNHQTPRLTQTCLVHNEQRLFAPNSIQEGARNRTSLIKNSDLLQCPIN